MKSSAKLDAAIEANLEGVGITGDLTTISLKELSIRITKGTTPTTLGHSFVTSGINFVKSEAISADGSIDPSKFAFIHAETHTKLQRSQLQEGDVLFSMAGIYLGKTTVVPEKILPANTNQAVGIIRLNRNKAEPRFIHYALSSPECRAWVSRSAAQSAQPNFNLQDIGNLPIPAYGIEEQRAIAHILGTLDDKIELNRRMNQTLEDMARALFKSWFMDFDGVAPEDMQESELGFIPKGWRVGTLADFATLNPESWTKKTRPSEILYVDLSNTKWGRIESVTPYSSKDAPSRAQRVLRPNDTIIGTVRPGNGSYAFIDEDGLTGSTGFAVLRPKRPEYSALVYLAAISPENIERLANLADGGAYPAVRPEIVTATCIAIADNATIATFSQHVSLMLERISENRRESKTLAQLRDTLLPKLISGELRVKDAKRIMEAVSP
jgi:type I restriction enzyme S subunit